MGYKGEWAILSAASTATNQNAWIKYMKLEAKKAKYKNMKYVEDLLRQRQPGPVAASRRSMLQAYPNLKGIESPTTVGISSAAQYLSNTPKYKGKIVLTGLGLPSQMKKYVHNNTVKEFALWNPEDLGYLAGYAVTALADGQDHGQGRRDVHGRQARQVQDHQGPQEARRSSSARRTCSTSPERRQVQVLDRRLRGRRCRGAPGAHG